MQTKSWLYKFCGSLVLCLIAIPFLISPSAPFSSDRSFTVTGKAVNIITRKPIEGAVINIVGQSSKTVTKSDGKFSLQTAKTTFNVHASAKGYIGMTQTSQKPGRPVTFEMIPKKLTEEQEKVIESKFRFAENLQTSDISSVNSASLSAGSVTVASSDLVPDTIKVLMPGPDGKTGTGDDFIQTMSVDEYLKGVVPREVGYTWPAEALKAQAVAARAYAITSHNHGAANVCTTTHCQVWGQTHYDTTDAAVEATHNVVPIYNGQVIRAFFFAHCDGHTRNSEDVWSTALPYARSVPCSCGYTTMYGHGVGMCQRGAEAMAKAGYSYVDIIRHYYTGVELAGIIPPEATQEYMVVNTGGNGLKLRLAPWGDIITTMPEGSRVWSDGQTQQNNGTWRYVYFNGRWGWAHGNYLQQLEYSAIYVSDNTPASMAAENNYSVSVTIKNTGSKTWKAGGANPVNLAYHWMDLNGNVVVWNGIRTSIGSDMAPGSQSTINATVKAPPTPGSYILKWDLVEEGVTWFSDKGVATRDKSVSVLP
ncbi:MAG: SpoIID/LytB domain-containing protein [Firmicutes bacterium]|nr:SpoIID/LytB domain-containing protein [Bacillota bacterium]